MDSEDFAKLGWISVDGGHLGGIGFLSFLFPSAYNRLGLFLQCFKACSYNWLTTGNVIREQEQVKQCFATSFLTIE